MPAVTTAPNPFALLMNPDAVLELVEHSSALDRLRRRVYRPLDRPQLSKAGAANEDSLEDEADEPTDFGH